MCLDINEAQEKPSIAKKGETWHLKGKWKAAVDERKDKQKEVT